MLKRESIKDGEVEAKRGEGDSDVHTVDLLFEYSFDEYVRLKNEFEKTDKKISSLFIFISLVFAVMLEISISLIPTVKHPVIYILLLSSGTALISGCKDLLLAYSPRNLNTIDPLEVMNEYYNKQPIKVKKILTGSISKICSEYIDSIYDKSELLRKAIFGFSIGLFIFIVTLVLNAVISIC